MLEFLFANSITWFVLRMGTINTKIEKMSSCVLRGCDCKVNSALIGCFFFISIELFLYDTNKTEVSLLAISISGYQFYYTYIIKSWKSFTLIGNLSYFSMKIKAFYYKLVYLRNISWYQRLFLVLKNTKYKHTNVFC